MILGLSCVSSRGIWVLVEPSKNSVPQFRVWSENETSQLSQKISSELDKLLETSKVSLEQIHSLVGVLGPGAFTGLRVTGSYLLGLGKALDVPVFSLPTFCLNIENAPFWIPLQHQKVKTLTLKESLDLGVEFLHLKSEQDFEIGIPSDSEIVWGLVEKPLWPEPEEFSAAIEKMHSLGVFKEFKLQYGSGPKIFGQRVS